MSSPSILALIEAARSVITEDDVKKIARNAIDAAIGGDKAARDFVLKFYFPEDVADLEKAARVKNIAFVPIVKPAEGESEGGTDGE